MQKARRVGTIFQIAADLAFRSLKATPAGKSLPGRRIVVGTACVGFAVAVEIEAEPSGVAADRLLDDPS